MGINYYTYFAYGVILDENESEAEYPMIEDNDDLSFADFEYFSLSSGAHVHFFGVSACIATDAEDMDYSTSDPQKWADYMKHAERQFDKTSLATRANFFVFLTSS